MESLIQKHSYAPSPIRTYGGEDDVLGDESQTTPNRGKVASKAMEFWEAEHLKENGGRSLMRWPVLRVHDARKGFQEPPWEGRAPTLILTDFIILPLNHRR